MNGQWKVPVKAARRANDKRINIIPFSFIVDILQVIVPINAYITFNLRPGRVLLKGFR